VTITVSITMRSAAAGGRATSFGAGYCPHLVVGRAAEMLGVRAAAGTGRTCPGQTALVEFEALYPEGIGVPPVACLALYAGFFLVLLLAERRRRLAVLLGAGLVAISAVWFVRDALGHNHQLQALTDHGCDHYYFTWWWYSDRLDPRR
jgi:hypothetical protein